MREIYLSSAALPAATAPEGRAYVYVVQKRNDGPVKVGVAVNARKRISDLENANGERFPRIWLLPPCEDFRRIESGAHSCMRPARLIGEWFDVDFDFATTVVLDIASGRKRSRTSFSSRAT